MMFNIYEIADQYCTINSSENTTSSRVSRASRSLVRTGGKTRAVGQVVQNQRMMVENEKNGGKLQLLHNKHWKQRPWQVKKEVLC